MNSLPAVPCPLDDTADLTRPGAEQVQQIALGVAAVIGDPPGELREIQRLMLEATFAAMTGHHPDFSAGTPSVDAVIEALRPRNAAFRNRIVQSMILGALIVRPLSPDVVARIRAVSAALGTDDGMIDVADQIAHGQFELAAVDFDRNGYTANWSDAHRSAVHLSRAMDTPWDSEPADPDLAARWQGLESLPEGTLGLAVSRFYRARGFHYPGTPGSVSPLLAQHDWVHVLADYGSTIDNELEVFAFIARANDDPKGFSFLAMVVSLFETGVIAHGAGLFEPDAGHLRRSGMPQRVADAMRRGALCNGSIDFLAIDWFEVADHPISELRDHFGIVDKSSQFASPGPFSPGGMTEYQWNTASAVAAERGVSVETWGASVAG
jgi:hypothetical protein